MNRLLKYFFEQTDKKLTAARTEFLHNFQRAFLKIHLPRLPKINKFAFLLCKNVNKFVTNVIEFPKITLSKINLPKFSLPQFNLTIPSLPKLPKLKLPKFNLPKLPKIRISAPKLPNLPKIKFPELTLPQFNLPQLPNLTLPPLPKFIYRPQATTYRSSKQYLFSISEAAKFLGVSAVFSKSKKWR